MTHQAPPRIVTPRKACSVNPLKSSAPLGAALAYLGMDRCLPLFHGSQGCTAFGLVLLVRHFKEAIPLQTTAMNEISTILGGIDNVEQACVNIAKRAKPKLIGIASTGLTETRGEDVAPELRFIKERNPELAETDLVFAATADYMGAMEEGWGRAVGAMVDTFVPRGRLPTVARQVNLLPGVHMTPGDIEDLREMVESFGLDPIILPDISGSLDGHVPDDYMGTSYGGTRLEDVARMGASAATLAFGSHMTKAAERLEARCGVPTTLIASATGLEYVDRLMVTLSEISGASVPARYRRQRSQLVDAMLDAHFHFGGRKIAMAAEPDLLRALSELFASMGAEIAVAVTSVASPALDHVPAETVVVGDLEDLEVAALEVGADLLVTHSHGRQAAARTGIPLWRAGFPMFDRLGAAHRVGVGYRGTRDIVFEVGNLLLDHLHAAGHDHDHGADDINSMHEEAGHGGAHVTAR
jgi:nitrogenase molybdenum-iron protein NifN